VAGRSGGVTGGGVTFDFNGLAVASRSALGQSLTSGGVQVGFAGEYYGKAGTDFVYSDYPFKSDALYNFNAFLPGHALVSMTFESGLVRGATFNFVLGAFGQANLKAWRTGCASPIASFLATENSVTGGGTSAFWGFDFNDGTGFDRLTIEASYALSSGTPSFAFDNLQVAPLTTVPEPGTVALTALGLAGLVITARRRRSRD
jgi:hypothetical protein